jgi:AcrR family transcriptional regulator
MSRWAPNARDRLEAAALELFSENGYEETTVAQIAERAGLNRATFFRHFADKREVLFGGEDVLADLFSEAIRGSAAGAPLIGLVRTALIAAEDVMTPQQKVKAARRVRVLAVNTEAQERGLLKHARIVTSITAALREQGCDELAARLGAQAALLAFSIAFERWMKDDGEESFLSFVPAALSDVQASAAELVAPTPHPA